MLRILFVPYWIEYKIRSIGYWLARTIWPCGRCRVEAARTGQSYESLYREIHESW